ncbi:DeoR family galactitol utilization operon repressor/DeoR family fructose operon transcriptional repressor [Amaricoccus macauensis]|uniref:DeoR family galactitol utilization operon repressor/DeoR family fructose operon transcriptional repressor n=1 Tax=Amaricoccus macauensis TaxID=57001 RepID=A0A840SUG2_9RHOB|nr:DeoR/GlpR family DNA-binding transcription regulator [Amaricoccus macauensis]MBB5222782.1 DeoR family galactitol utilization operon repressor/DeoR family fructose operon transcriptional repressor [Amaricoccus macauensis]
MTDSFEPSQSDDMLPAERRDRIIEWFVAHQVASTQDLAKWLGASISTIRRDLDYLASQGIVRRTHGGAVRVRRNTTSEPLASEAQSIAVEEKRAIAAVAAGLLLPGQSVMLDTRTTLHHAAYAIADLTIPLTIVTNDVHAASVLANRAHIKLLVPGGICRDGAYVLLGESGIRMVQELRCDHLFLGAQAVDLECVSDTSLELVQLQKAMIDAALETTLLLDSSRFGSRAIYRTAPIERLRRIITDEGLPVEERERYASVVPELLVAPFPDGSADDR